MGDRQDVLISSAAAEPLLGRAAEQAVISEFLADLSRGRHLLMVAGEAGIGKSVLWAHAVQAAAAGGGHRVLSTSATASEASLPYTVLTDLLWPVVDLTVDLHKPLRDAVEVALLLRAGDPADRGQARAVARATLELLRLLSQHDPVLVAVDGLQWADAESRAALTFALRRLGDEAVGLLATARDPVDAGGLEARQGGSATDLLVLGPLEEGAFAEVVQTRSALHLPPLAMEHLHAATGGNPGAAMLIAEETRRRGNPPLRPDRFPIPEVLARPFADALNALPATVHELLLTAAVMTQPTLTEIEAATGRPAIGASNLDLAMAAGLITVAGDRVRFTHALLPSVICDRATMADRRGTHERLSGAMRNPDERVRHRAFAATDVDAALAHDLGQAGRRAGARGATLLAADYLTLAARFTPNDQREAAVQRRVQAAAYHRAAGNSDRARPLLERAAAEAKPGEARAAVLLALAELRRDSGDLGAAITLLHLAGSEEPGPPELRSRINLQLAGTFLTSGDAAGGRQRAAEAVTEARRAGPGVELAGALTLSVVLDRITGGYSSPERLLEAAGMADAVSVPVMFSPIVELARRDMATGQLDAARGRLEHLHRQLLLVGRHYELPYLVGHLAALECLAARWDMAATYASEGLEEARRSGQRILVPWLLHTQAYARACRGQLAEAREAADMGLHLAAEYGVAWWAWRNRWVQGLIALSTGELQAAAEILVPLQRATSQAGIADVDHTPWCTDAVEALIGLGDTEGAEAVLSEHEDLLPRHGPSLAILVADRCRGLLDAAHGDRAGGMTRLERSAEGLKSLGYPFELARSLVALGVTQRRDRKPTAAHASLSGAHAVFERTNTAVWAARTRTELVLTESPAGGPLTATEHRVASLAAGGHTNREIAGLVYMSPKTVESHLSRIYRKLGIRSRAELGRTLDG